MISRAEEKTTNSETKSKLTTCYTQRNIDKWKQHLAIKVWFINIFKFKWFRFLKWPTFEISRFCVEKSHIAKFMLKLKVQHLVLTNKLETHSQSNAYNRSSSFLSGMRITFEYLGTWGTVEAFLGETRILNP